MTRYADMMTRLERGECIVIDGATGTEIERRGVPQVDNAWNAGGALSHPDILRQVHADYLEAGAEIVISNTFATHLSALRDAGREDDFDPLNRRGVELAVEARDGRDSPTALVAGGISHWSWTRNVPSVDEFRSNAAAQAAIMAEAGADLIVLEMMIEIESMLAVLDGVESAGLPIWIGFTCGEEDGTAPPGPARLRNGELLGDAIGAIADRDVPVITIMHTDVGLIDRCLDVVTESWAGRVGVYAHSGDYIDGRWVFEGVISPSEYARMVIDWVGRGVQIVGGCCGTSPDHIRALADADLGPGTG